MLNASTWKHVLVCWLLAGIVRVRSIENNDFGYEKGDPAEQARSIFDYSKNGIRVDVKVIPANVNESRLQPTTEDGFPEFPFKDLGRCIIDLSLYCIQKRFARFLGDIGSLDQIFLVGQDVKLVKTRVQRNIERSDVTDIGKIIDRSIDDFFDTFVLRITVPRWNGKKEKNQIDIMYDDNMGMSEGRGKKGGGKGGGKCKKMMMMAVMMVKMKVMGMVGMAAMKGMMMAGMSLMISKAMLIMKLMSLKKGGGGGGGGGPWQSGGGGQLKEIVLLTKSSSSGSAPIDSYGAPPPTSYGPPSSGGGGYDYSGGGGGGWGRSFDKRIPMMNYPTNDGSSILTPLIGETVGPSSEEEYLVPRSNFSSPYFEWNRPITYDDKLDVNSNYVSKRSNRQLSATNPLSYIVYASRSDDPYKTLNSLKPAYSNEWQAIAEEPKPIDGLSKLATVAN